MHRRTFLQLAATAAPLLAAADDFPSAEISNGKIKARLYLPDDKRGYYRGTRFDWSGVIASLECGGHSYFGVWFDKYDPKLHDAITGPVEEFLTKDGSTLGYDAAKPGETFIRIGAGVLRKTKDEKFQRFFTYDIVDPGKWKVAAKKDAVAFTHTLRDAKSGYAYQYRKTVRLVPGKPELIIDHALKNTGSKPIETDVYNHNFFVIDGQPTGPDFSITFPFEPKPSTDFQGKAAIKGRELSYTRVFQKGDTTIAILSGFGNTPADHDIRVVNRKTGAAVRYTGDKPLSKIVYWSAERTLSPENYISLSADPGREVKWSLRYEFTSQKS